MNSPPDDWPTDLNALAAIAADPMAAPDCRDRAWADLEPSIARQAKSVAFTLGFRGQRREEFVKEAPGQVFEKIVKYRAERNYFQPWLRRVLTNLGYDNERRRQRRRELPEGAGNFGEREDLSNPEDVSGPDGGRLLDQLAALRVHLGRVASDPPDAGRSFDAIALVLYQLRVRIAVGLQGAKVADGGANVADVRIADLAATILPWSAAVAARRLGPGLPPLGHLWEAMKAVVEAEPPAAWTEAVLEVVNAGRSAPIIQNTWHQWLKRARERVRGRVGENVWCKLFAPLLNPTPCPREDST